MSKPKAAPSENAKPRGTASAPEPTELQQRILELEENARRSQEFLGSLGHELRNPLAPMRNSLHFLKLACGSDADIQESLGIIERQMQNLLRLLDDLRDVSRMARITDRVEKQKTNLAAIIRRAIKMCQAEMDAAEQRVVVDLPNESIQIEADVDRLAQAFAKLLHNAAKYSEPGGTVTVRSEVKQRSIIVHVIDTGIGIDPNKLSEIFDLYSQLNDPRAHTQGGLGIGLTVAKDIIRLHGGTIEANSDGAGKGSDFVMTLPICE